MGRLFPGNQQETANCGGLRKTKEKQTLLFQTREVVVTTKMDAFPLRSAWTFKNYVNDLRIGRCASCVGKKQACSQAMSCCCFLVNRGFDQ